MDRITVRFAIDAPTMNRHRVSVWDENGGVLSPPSSDVPVDLMLAAGETIWVEASVPGTPTRNTRPGRDERRWQLCAGNDARAVLNLGRKGKHGAAGTHLAITVDGAGQRRASKQHG